MGMGVYQARHDIVARQLLRTGNRLPDQASAAVHPQINRPVTIGQRHRMHKP
jgi:hypothetical protein